MIDIDDIQLEADDRMDKTVQTLVGTFAKIRTGRANPALLDGIEVPYYGTDTPLNQVSNVVVEDARTLVIKPYERGLIPAIVKAILRSDLGLNPATSEDLVRVPLPPLTEETRKDFIRHARHEAENARIAVRNIRRDANAHLKDLVKNKEAGKDEERRAEEEIQKLTDSHIAGIDRLLEVKEQELMEI